MTTTRKERPRRASSRERAKAQDKATAAAKEAVATLPAPPVRQPDFVWAGQPVYQCHLGCGDRYQRIADLPAVEAHERNEHPTNLRATGLLDAKGQPVIVRVD